MTNTAILTVSALLVLATAALTASSHHGHAPVAVEAGAARDAAGEATVVEETAA